MTNIKKILYQFLFLTVLILVLYTSGFARQASENYTIEEETFTGGAVISNSEGFSASSYVGQSSPIGATESENYKVTDNNSVIEESVCPTLGDINTTQDVVPIGTPVTINTVFFDPDINEIHSFKCNWDDGTINLETLSQGVRTIEDSHIYTTPGVYTVTLTVSDGNCVSDSQIFQYIVVFDPTSGFVTGGGWFDSPPEAYTADLNLTGRANFGFVSKYKKNEAVPTGTTEFQFEMADFNFHSDSYEWLVVAGVKAMFKGVGTINGQGEYNFILTAIDADINSNDNVEIDRFRIRIWTEDEFGNEGVIYDNGLDDDSDDATTEIGGGSIVIHTVKGKK